MGMPLHAAFMLGLGLWLGLTLAQEGPRPSISVQPGPKVLLGHPVTIVCRGPAGAYTFRLEKKHRGDGTTETYQCCASLDQNCCSLDQTPMNCDYVNQTTVSRDDSYKTEAQFHIQKVCKSFEVSYRCRYCISGRWSMPSNPLVLEVTSEDDSSKMHTVSEQDSVFPTLHPPIAPRTPSRSPSVANQVRLGLAGGILLALMGILAEAWYSRHQARRKSSRAMGSLVPGGTCGRGKTPIESASLC